MKPSSRLKAAWMLCAATALIAGIAVPANGQSAPPDIVVTAKDNGKDITLHGNQRLIIRLANPGGPSAWQALMTPDSILAFTEKPAAEEKKLPDAKTTGKPELVMVGGSHDEVFAFRAVSFTESSSQWFALIYCSAQCDPKEKGTKVFKLGITTKKN